MAMNRVKYIASFVCYLMADFPTKYIIGAIEQAEVVMSSSQDRYGLDSHDASRHLETVSRLRGAFCKPKQRNHPSQIIFTIGD